MSWSPDRGSLRIGVLRSLYRSGQLTPTALIEAIFHRLGAAGEDHVWISRVPRAEALRRVATLKPEDPGLPLYGIPFAVKDNLDVEGLPTTAGCPAFRYLPKRSAVVVEKLLTAGAILIGKTNMDQFATGLVGVRSPYGIPKNPFDERYVPGGSSSGSAVAVAKGFVSFSLGTDTAGSGRVPAAFNNIVGWKPTPGLVSTEGVVPACRSLDCVSVFALTCEDAAYVASTVGEAIHVGGADQPAGPVATFRFGIPSTEARAFFGDPETPALFELAIENLRELGGTPIVIDMEPLGEVARLLYDGPWIAERMAGLKGFLEQHADDVFPVTRSIIERGARYSAVQAFEGFYRLQELRQCVKPMWDQVDVLLLPTAGTTYRLDEVAADPIATNSNLGFYTNFVNLLGYSALAIPSGFDSRGLPFGVTLIGPVNHDGALLRLGDRLQRFGGLRLGATEEIVSARNAAMHDHTILAVVGAHLRGLPLNWQLIENGAIFVRKCRTAPAYRLFELPNSTPPKPGLARVAEGGVPIEVELWQIPLKRFGQFVDFVPAPLAIGSVMLETGEVVKGFLCESAALGASRDISHYGGWKAFLNKEVPARAPLSQQQVRHRTR
jgi:allophanate hydrolase